MDKNINFNDTALKAKQLSGSILKSISQVIDSGIYLQGRQNVILEKELEKMFQGKMTTVASGHDGLILALSALHLNKNDEIIFPVNSYPTAHPLYLSGAKLVPCDVDENGLISIDDIKRKITKKTKVIVIVHLYGLVCDIDKIKKTIKNRKIILIEDCAQAFGAKYKNEFVGSFGDISCFSFYPTKNLSTLGDGGAIRTNNKQYHDYFLKAKSYGETDRYLSLFPSGHSRLPEIQAAILNVYLKSIGRSIKKRQELSQYFVAKIKEHQLDKFLRPLITHDDMMIPAPHLFVVEVKKRDQLKSYLISKSIPCLIHYPYPVHLVPAFRTLGYKKGDFPMAERLANNILSLPFHPMMSKTQIDDIMVQISKFYL